MKVIIHRGSRQIGGSCIEVASGATRIILDAGLPLDVPTSSRCEALELQPLAVTRAYPHPDAIILSHAHCDHAGLVNSFPGDVPVWLTEATSKVVLAGTLFAKQADLGRRSKNRLPEGTPIQIGPFRVTALPVDHSIFGAVAVLVEADGKRLLYTGDLRFHGRKPGMARSVVAHVKKAPLDALIVEGTRLGDRSSEENLTEKSLEQCLVSDIGKAPGIVLAMYSPLNVDRFVTYFKAALRTGRTMVIDPYQAFVLHLVGAQSRVPRPDGAKLRVLIPRRFPFSMAGRRLSKTRWFAGLAKASISCDEIRKSPEQFVVLYRPSFQEWLFPGGHLSGTVCVYSYWPGYLREVRMQSLIRDVEAADGKFFRRHASGHAHPDDLRRFVEQICPGLIVPVHTNSPEAWERWFSQAAPATDGAPVILGTS